MIDIGTLELLMSLKDQKRSGWLIRGVREPESVADHSWSSALLCLLHAERAGVNRDRAVAIALVHDIAEALTGDVAARVDERDRSVSLREKALRERQAIDSLFPNRGPIPADALPGPRELWLEYEAAATAEALFVRDMNLIDMCLQALYYERAGRYQPAGDYPNSGGFERLDEFFATADARIATPVGRELYDQIMAEYRRLR